MRTAHSLTVSRRILRRPPAMHAPLQPCMPTPPTTMHASQQPHMPPSNHAHPPATMSTPQQPSMPPATMHAPLPPVDRIVDTRFWKYYLAPTSLRAVMITSNYR